MSSPWRKIEKPKPENFVDIMSEQVARNLDAKKRKLQEKTDDKIFVPDVNYNDGVNSGAPPPTCDNGSEPEEEEVYNRNTEDLDRCDLLNKELDSRRCQGRPSRMNKIRDETVFGIVNSTCNLLPKISQSINSVIATGNKAVIYHANPDPSYFRAVEPLPGECVIKVFFKTTSSKRKQRGNQFNFKGCGHTTQKTINLCAEEHMANLTRLRTSGVPCPQVVKLKENVLVTSFIGENQRPAPKLKDATDVDYCKAYREVVKAMKTIYEEANLILADLSEFNILWHDKRCYFIDVSQSVEPWHEEAFEYLHKNCINITKFFTRKGVLETATPDELFKDITGHDFTDQASFLQQYSHRLFKVKPHLKDRPGFEPVFNFDVAWEQSTAEQR